LKITKPGPINLIGYKGQDEIIQNSEDRGENPYLVFSGWYYYLIFKGVKMVSKPKRFFILMVVLFGLILSFEVQAGGFGGGSGMPWDTFLQKLSASLTGPWAGAISLIGIVVAGTTLILGGGEIGHFFRSLIYLILVISIIVGSQSLLSGMGLISGATIDNSEIEVALWKL